MLEIILFEDNSAYDLLPFTYTRPIYDLRVGIDKLSEKWTRVCGEAVQTWAWETQKPIFHRISAQANEACLFLNGKVVADERLLQYARENLEEHDALVSPDNDLLAFVAYPQEMEKAPPHFGADSLNFVHSREVYPHHHELTLIKHPWDMFRRNGQVLRDDFEALTKGRKSAAINDPHTIVYNAAEVFVEPGARIKAAVLDAEAGPIYIGKGADIQPGAVIRGAHAICANAVVNVGAKLRGDSTIGPWCKVGGEVSNSVLQGYSNKAHDGFLGNSVIGYWCNLGADTNISNLKNNYSTIKAYSHRLEQYVDTGLMFCGLMMADHSKAGINTMFNTGTVVGVSCNIFGGDFPPKFIPSFSWGSAEGGFSEYKLEKAFETAERVMQRRKIPFTDKDVHLLRAIFNTTEHQRY